MNSVDRVQIDPDVILDYVAKEEAALVAYAARGGEPVAGVRWNAQRMLNGFRDAIEQAREPYHSTARATIETGWDESALRRQARRKLLGQPLSEAWAGLQVRRRDKRTFEFQLSSIPPQP